MCGVEDLVEGCGFVCLVEVVVLDFVLLCFEGV